MMAPLLLLLLLLPGLQAPHISAAASQFTLALAPALFMDAADQCCRRYLSAQVRRGLGLRVKGLALRVEG
jgi:hypothetical protein